MEKPYSKGKWKSFSIPAKPKSHFHCIGRFQNVLFCSDFEKKMWTIRISFNNGGTWVLPTGILLSVGFAPQSSRGGDPQPPRGRRYWAPSSAPSPHAGRSLLGCSPARRSGARRAAGGRAGTSPPRSPSLFPLIPPQIKWQRCKCGARCGERGWLHNGRHRCLHPVTLLQVINCPVKCFEIHCMKNAI